MTSRQAASRIEPAEARSLVGLPSPDDTLEDSPAETVIERAAEAAREMLGMDMAYLADTRGGLQGYRAVTGEAASFGASVDRPVSLEGTHCERMLDGRLEL